MSDIKDWSNDANIPPTVGNQVPDFMPEGATPIGSVNDWGRETQAAIRRFYETFEWRDFGHTTTYATPGSFTVAPGGAGAFYAVGQRIAVAHGGGTLYTTITDITGDTLTVSGTLTAPVSAVAAGVNPVGQPIAAEALSGTATIDTQGTHTGPVVGDAVGDHAGTFTGSVKDGSDIEGDVVGVTQPVADSSDKLSTTQHVTDKLIARGGWELLEKWTTPGDEPDHDFAFDPAKYSEIKLVGVGINLTNDSRELKYQLGHTGGTVFINTTDISTFWASSNGALGFELTLFAIGNAGNPNFGRLWARSRSYGLSTETEHDVRDDVIDAVRLLWGGNVNFAAGGEVYMYGLGK